MNIDPRIRKLVNTLDAGEIARYHAVPSVRPQSDAHHCWNMLVLALYITNGKVSAELMTEITLHDTGELEVGDIPFTLKRALKRDNPVLAQQLRLMETVARQETTICGPVGLDVRDQAILKLCDTLEGFIWCAKYESNQIVFNRWEGAYEDCQLKFATPVIITQEWERADSVFGFFKEWRDSR